MLAAGAQGGSCDAFPASSIQIPLAFIEGARPYDAASGILVQNVASPAAFIPLVGVGPTGPVTQATSLYLKSDGPCVLRLTNDDGGGGTVVQTIPIHGLILVEFPVTQPLELLEIQGEVRIEYFVSGPS